MTEPAEYVENEARDLLLAKMRAQNLKQPSVPNCTKVVRLFVVDRERTFEDIVAHENPTRGDVFVVTRSDGNVAAQGSAGSGGDLYPMTWLGGHELVEHQHAHHQHRGTVPVLTGIDRDQIEWQCDVPFRVSRIEKVVDGHDHGFPGHDGPDYPFEKSLPDINDRRGDDCRPIRSGPTKIILHHDRPIDWKQLYKAHFELKIGETWKPLDPDFYCDWR
jgi:hypothetical protein